MRTALFLLIATCAPAFAADDPKATIEKAIKAAGYSADDPPNHTWKDKGAIEFAGMKIEYTANWFVQLPDKHKFDMEADFGGMKIPITFICNGDKVWQSAMGMGEDVTGEKHDFTMQRQYQFWVLALTPILADAKFKLEAVPDKDVDGKAHTGVKVSYPRQADTTLYFDKETGLFAKSEVKVKDEFQGWKEVVEEVFYTGWKGEGKRKRFTKMNVVRDGKHLMTTEMTEAKNPKELDAKTFEKP